jgi:O-succinylbenzoic acid--CoA ligase
MPLCHVGGLSIPLRAALHGFAVMLTGRFDAVAVARVLHTQRVTLLSMGPTMLVRLLEAAGAAPFPLGLRCALIGGGGCSTDLIARARACGLPAVPTYGMTEAASQICTADADDVTTAPGSVGRPLAGLDLRVLAPDAAGWGQIAVRGPQITAGYFRNADATAHAFEAGWLQTGDVGRVDTTGRVWVLGRGTDLIVTGGEKVVPDEVEAVLATHPSVQEAAVYGVPDPLWGQRVAAAVVLRRGAELEVADLQAWCRGRVAGFKVPRQFQAVTMLPRTASGKVQRHLLRS